jgi:hypothetical protein
MKHSENEDVQRFLEEIKFIDPYKYSVLMSLREILLMNFPRSNERIMYGGIMFSIESEFYSGLFHRKNHISLEFSIGFLMTDPNKFLEGKGKYRRHLKIRSNEDVLSKNVDYYVKQALQTLE